MTYQIQRWPEFFEGAKSKTYNNKSACTMPTKHGLGYRRLVKRKDGAAMFGAWCALVQVLSRHPKSRHGYLTNDGTPDGTPYTADDLECLTDIPAKHFAALFIACTSESVDWLTVTGATDTTGIPQGYHKGVQSQLDSDSDLDLDSDLNSNSNAKRDCLHTAKGKSLSGQRLSDFNLFWDTFGYKKGKRQAADSWLAIRDYSPELVAKIIAGAKLAAETRHDFMAGGGTPKMAQGWLTGCRWEDENTPLPTRAGKSGADSVWAMTEKLKRLQDKRDLKWTDDEWRKGDECKRMNVEIRRLKKELEA